MSKMVAIRLEDRLLSEVDRERRRRRLTRAGAIRDAIVMWVERQKLEQAMRKDRDGYARKPVRDGEFGPVLGAQRWPK